MLPLNWGVIELAKKTRIQIIPLIMECHPKCCYAKFGNAIYINEEIDKKDGIEQLKVEMATLKWDIWEKFLVESRSERMKEEFEQMIQQRIGAYPKFDYEMLIEACDIFAYPFAGDWELMYATIDDYFLRANGVLWVDTSDREE